MRKVNLLYKVLTVFVLLFIIIVLVSTQLSRRDYMDLVFLDVGQGDAALIDIHNKNVNPIRIMIDTGRERKVISSIDKFYSSNFKKYFSQIIIAKDIDTLILTHNDSDHVAMRCEIINRYNVKQIIISSSMSTSTLLACDKNKEIENKLINNIKLNYIHAGDSISIRNINLKILNPEKGEAKNNSDNQKSIVILLKAYNNKILFTGDIDKKVEREIISHPPAPSQREEELRNIDILKIAHHGSDGSSDDIFIKYTKPKVSVISVGRNSYGHPSPRVIDDLTSASSTIYRTDQGGNVMFHFE